MGVTVSGRGAPEHRSANSAGSASWLPPRLPPARRGPSMEPVAPESTQLCAARLGPSIREPKKGSWCGNAGVPVRCLYISELDAVEVLPKA